MENENENIYTCDWCNREVEENEVNHCYGADLCNECYEHAVFCSRCGDICNADEEGRYINGEYVCQDCIDEHYYECDGCGEDVEDCDVHSGEDEDGNTIHLCDSCYDDVYICDDCGCYIEEGNQYYYEGEYYCRSCYESIEEEEEQEEEQILSYHARHPEWKTYDLGENPRFYIGTENETGNRETSRNENEVASFLHKKLNCYLMRDSSIGTCSGIEVITEPQSYEYIMKNKDNIKEAFKFMIEKGYRSSDLGTCGLHFHLTRLENDKETVARLWSILEQWEEPIEKIGGRQGNSYANWYVANYGVSKQEFKSTETIKEKYLKNNGTRYLAINNTNKKTIELRFCKGTLNFDTYMARLQFIYNLYNVAINHDLPLNKIKWNDLIKGEYIEKYVKAKGIKNTIKLEDKNNMFASLKIRKENLLKQIKENKIAKWTKVITKLSATTLKEKTKDKDIKTYLNDMYRYAGLSNGMAKCFLDIVKYNELNEIKNSLANFLFYYKDRLNEISIYNKSKSYDVVVDIKNIIEKIKKLEKLEKGEK